MRRRVCSVLALLALAVAFTPEAARGDIITPLFFDGFESDSPNVLNAALTNWNVTSGSVDVLSPGNLCGPSGSFSNCVDLDGTGAIAGTIETKQTFALDAGLYRLSFDLAGANRPWSGSESNTVHVALGSYYTGAFTMLQYDPFETYTLDINVANAGLGKIVFSHDGNDWIGVLLDNVSLAHVVLVPDEPEIIPTPEPGSWELFASALGLVAWRFRKRS